MLLPAFTSSYCLLKSCLGKRLASSLSKAEPKQGEVWVLEIVTPFKQLALEYRKYLTWINSDENREFVCKGENLVLLLFVFKLQVCGYVVFFWKLFGERAAQRAAGSNSEHWQR